MKAELKRVYQAPMICNRIIRLLASSGRTGRHFVQRSLQAPRAMFGSKRRRSLLALVRLTVARQICSAGESRQQVTRQRMVRRSISAARTRTVSIWAREPPRAAGIAATVLLAVVPRKSHVLAGASFAIVADL
ncbi:unnamed protein product [Prorocentrum cordatum]|uniref:Uncharacterized protein n=1 Tax=Prorocentrum cordatum TaxID=2364126 RepID=A0ABN9XR79_9DINO|nr:unnamed protein product [Polarella glacialis]